MTNKKTVIINFLLVIWIFANLWLAKPYKVDFTILPVLVLAIAIFNILVFAWIGWIGWYYRKKFLSFFYPLVVLIIWIVGPAYMAIFRWGKSAFFKFLFYERSFFFWFYVFFCVLLYIFFALRGWKVQQRSNDQTLIID